MTLSARERDIDAAVRSFNKSATLLHHMLRTGLMVFEQDEIAERFATIQSTRLAASTLSHCGHTKRKAKTDRVHDALRAVV